MTPTVSIIIPVYNVEKYLNECLDSIINWSFSDWEAIIIDDGSSDNSGTICDEYAEKDSRFRVVHKQNEGVSVARNVGLDLARGEWCWFVDSDDVIDINTPVDFDKIHDKDIIMFDIKTFNDGDSVPINNVDVSYEQSDDLNHFYSKWISYTHQTIWYKRKFWDKGGSLVIRFTKGIKLGEDLEFMRKCEFLSSNPIKVNHPNYYYRLRESSAYHAPKIAQRVINDTFLVLDNLRCFIKQNHIQSADWVLHRLSNLAITIPAFALKDNCWDKSMQSKYRDAIMKYENMGFRLSSAKYIYMAVRYPNLLPYVVTLRDIINRLFKRSNG